MSYDSISVNRALGEYLISVSLREPELLKELRAETAHQAYGGMQIAAEQGQLMALLVRLMRAKRCIEIGTFTGYSSLSVALALPADGKLICCDVNPETTAIAQRYWRKAGVAEKIELRLAPALETLDALLSAGAAGSFDFAFIDADKPEYDQYYEACLKLLRPGGLAVIDNVLWSGQVADPGRRDQSTTALKKLNRKIHEDARIDLSMLPLGDGVTLALKR
jgi:predicted O-methyltransferase YrrM